MNTIDVLVLVVLVVNGLIGLFRGFVWQAFRILSLVLAFWLGMRWSDTIADQWLIHLSALKDDPSNRRVIAWAVLVVVVYIVMYLLGHVCRSLLTRARLSSADRALGFILGGLKGAAFVALAFQVLLIFLPFLPTDVQSQLVGGKNGAPPPPSQAFALHGQLLAKRLGDVMPSDMEQDLRRGMVELQSRKQR